MAAGVIHENMKREGLTHHALRFNILASCVNLADKQAHGYSRADRSQVLFFNETLIECKHSTNGSARKTKEMRRICHGECILAMRRSHETYSITADMEV